MPVDPADLWMDGALSAEAAAEFVGVRRRSFYALAKRHQFPRRFVGTKPVWSRRALAVWLAEQPTECELSRERGQRAKKLSAAK